MQVSHMTYGEALHTMPPSGSASHLPATLCPSRHVDPSTKRASEFRFVNTAKYEQRPPPTYDMYPTTTTNTTVTGTRRHHLPSTMHSAAAVDVYPYSNTSTAYNTVSDQRVMSTDHIYERTFVTTVPEPCHEDVGNTSTMEQNYFVLEPEATQRGSKVAN